MRSTQPASSAVVLFAQQVATITLVGVVASVAAASLDSNTPPQKGMHLNSDIGNHIYRAFGGENSEVLLRPPAKGVYPGWDRGMWSSVSISSRNHSGWAPGDPIDNSTKIPLGVGLNYLHQVRKRNRKTTPRA